MRILNTKVCRLCNASFVVEFRGQEYCKECLNPNLVTTPKQLELNKKLKVVTKSRIIT